LWTNVYEAFKRANGRNEPPTPRQFFRETLEANYGLQDLDQKYWDTWNGLKMGPTQSVTEYNVDFQQALIDLAGHVTDEQVKIEKYRAGLQQDLHHMCKTSPAGTRWARLTDLCSMQRCSGQTCRSALPEARRRPMSRPKSEGNVRLQVVEPRAQVAPASPS
jgi:hypothetical protein